MEFGWNVGDTISVTKINKFYLNILSTYFIYVYTMEKEDIK
jgi:hypothetical protein